MFERFWLTRTFKRICGGHCQVTSQIGVKVIGHCQGLSSSPRTVAVRWQQMAQVHQVIGFSAPFHVEEFTVNPYAMETNQKDDIMAIGQESEQPSGSFIRGPRHLDQECQNQHQVFHVTRSFET